MKKILPIIIILFLAIGIVYGGNNTASVIDAKNITYDYNITIALESGDSNISFANNMTGYCVEYREHSATENDTFYIGNTSHIKNNKTDKDVSNYIKTFFVYFHENTLSNNLTYRGKPVNQTIFNQHIIWYFTDNFTSSIVIQNSSELIEQIIKKADTTNVPDKGCLKVNNTTLMRYMFCTLLASHEHHQNFFGYNIWFENVTNNQTNTTNTTENETHSNITQNNTNNTNNTNNANNTQNQNIIQNSTQRHNITHNDTQYKTYREYIHLKHYKTGNPIISLIAIITFVCSLLIIKEE